MIHRVMLTILLIRDMYMEVIRKVLSIFVMCSRNMMNHGPQTGYPQKQNQVMYESMQNPSAPQQDAYTTGMQGNRGMMDRVDVQQTATPYPYNQRTQQLNTPWIHNQQGSY